LAGVLHFLFGTGTSIAVQPATRSEQQMVGETSPNQDQDSGSTLDQAILAAQRGDLAKARSIAEGGLQADAADIVPIHAFLGMVCAQLQDLPAAAGHLAKAHALMPQDITIACNLVAILMDQGRDAEALAVATAELAQADKSLRVARYRAFLAQKLERFADAITAYELVLAGHPDDFECWNNLGNARAGADDYEGAVKALRRAIELDPRAAPARLNLADALLALDHVDESEAELVKAIDEFPDDARLPYQLYLLYKMQLKQEEALTALIKAADRDPNSADYQLKLAIEYGVLRRTEDAERAYLRTIELDPTELDAYLGLAIQYEHTNREEEFAPLIALARKNGIAPEPLAYVEALQLRRAERFEEALIKLDAVPADVEPIRVSHARATLLDRLGRTDEAFDTYTRANILAYEDNPTAPLDRGSELREQLAQEINMLTPDWRDSWRKAEITDERPDPVFLVGFPRSGTTLLDTILMGHPDTVVMEEQPPLNHVEEALGGLSALGGMDSDAIAKARDDYFTEVEKIQPLAPGQLLVDKSPLFLYRLPLIQRLFPKAKIILALRHPCDVVLSCFMANFRLNSAMANFLRLEDTAQLYDLAFRHWQTSLALFPANVHLIVYERLVEDVATEVRPLFDFLDLQWDDNVLDHSRTAKSRGLITTASYAQVTEPIYQRASGRWEKYRDHLAPAIPVLEPWIEKFGYQS
jgi:tetratricopeptide (TPR) repeat protein